MYNDCNPALFNARIYYQFENVWDEKNNVESSIGICVSVNINNV